MAYHGFERSGNKCASVRRIGNGGGFMVLELLKLATEISGTRFGSFHCLNPFTGLMNNVLQIQNVVFCREESIGLLAELFFGSLRLAFRPVHQRQICFGRSIFRIGISTLVWGLVLISFMKIQDTRSCLEKS